MKKMLILLSAVLLTLSSCGSYEATGAYTGAQFGSVIGSAIGGLTGGWRGSDVGTLIGMAGGAAVGAAIGKAADGRAAETSHRTNSYDDRIMMEQPMQRSYAADAALEIRHLQLSDYDGDGRLVRGETARVVFEICNTSNRPIYSVLPSVREVTGNKHVHISENVLVECIKPKETIRYTAQLKADNGLRNGEALLRVAIFQAGNEITAQTREMRIETCKK